MLERGAGTAGARARIGYAYLPLKVSLAYLLGTLGLFLLTPFSAQAENLPALILFLLLATACFTVGYHLSIVQSRRYQSFRPEVRQLSTSIKVLVVASSLWFLTFSLASLAEYGASSFSDILHAAQNPSASYFAKFDVYAEQQATGRTSLPIQLSVLAGALYAVLIPFTVCYWRQLSTALRSIALVSALSYVAYFVFIGTQKGVGDLLIMAFAALAACALPIRKESKDSVAKSQATPRSKAATARWTFAVVILFSVGFVGYMANNQGDRIEGLSIAGKFEPNPAVTAVFGEKFSRGLAVASYYPTNGYIGLSKNLTVPFVWAGGLGGAPALGSYKTQYFGGDDPAELSYPVRTEAITGWPAGQYWSTIYPWLASDLSFPGAALFMSAVGWFMARMWLGARLERDPLSLILFCQTAIFIAYVPANNQLMSSRYTALGIITLLSIYVVRRLIGNAQVVKS